MRTDEETGQTIISGMGELHLEIHHRPSGARVQGRSVRVGKPQVAYRENTGGEGRGTRSVRPPGRRQGPVRRRRHTGRAQRDRCWLDLSRQRFAGRRRSRRSSCRRSRVVSRIRRLQRGCAGGLSRRRYRGDADRPAVIPRGRLERDGFKIAASIGGSRTPCKSRRAPQPCSSRIMERRGGDVPEDYPGRRHR